METCACRVRALANLQRLGALRFVIVCAQYIYGYMRTFFGYAVSASHFPNSPPPVLFCAFFERTPFHIHTRNGLRQRFYVRICTITSYHKLPCVNTVRKIRRTIENSTNLFNGTPPSPFDFTRRHWWWCGFPLLFLRPHKSVSAHCRGNVVVLVHRTAHH